jgi:predicted dehydrogenase
MKQVVQNIRTGVTSVRDVPAPIAGSRDVIVHMCASLVSAGTERYVVDLAKSSLMRKAMQRPDHVKRVIEKMRTEGVRSTLTQVGAKLDEPMPLGYSGAGIVLDAGDAVRRVRPGDRVAVVAPHAGVVSVGPNLVARMPDGLAFDRAAYAAVGAIALQGVRLARVSLGERVLVIGLGLIGLMTSALLKAQGCHVFGVEPDQSRRDLGAAFGVESTSASSDDEAVRAFSGGYGVDAVIITAATTSNQPIEFAAAMCRPKGRIVLVGVTGLDIPRQPFFEKELEFVVSSSLGPGRSDPAYEGKGRDYPIGHVRWTMQRNMEAVLDQIASGALPVDRLTTHRFEIDRAAEAYDLLTGRREPYLGIVLEYSQEPVAPVRRVDSRGAAAPKKTGRQTVSVIGAGNFARLVLLPALTAMDGISLGGICTAKGLTATSVADSAGFKYAATDVDQILNDPETDIVFVLTRHDLHGRQVAAALAAGKHVFVEKPLCLTLEELAEIERAVTSGGGVLTVGFNRRFAPATRHLLDHVRGLSPLTVSYRFATRAIPPDAWPNDVEIGGGRIVGEACHAIDFCIALAGSPVVRVFAEAVAPVGGVRTRDDRVLITMRHESGSTSSVIYQAVDTAGIGERIEVFAGARVATLEDWDHLELWDRGRVTRERGRKDKGHAAGLRAFLNACRGGSDWPISWEQLRSSAWTSLAAVESLRTGFAVDTDSSF